MNMEVFVCCALMEFCPSPDIMFMMRSELGSFTLKRLFGSANRRFLNKACIAARGLNQLFKMLPDTFDNHPNLSE